MSAALPWLAVALLGVAIATAIGAMVARSLFVTCVHVAVTGVAVAAAVLLLGADDGGLALAVFAAAWAPVLRATAIAAVNNAVTGPLIPLARVVTVTPSPRRLGRLGDRLASAV